MADNFVLHGDTEALVLHILKNLTPELTGADLRFSTNLVGYNEGDRWVTVSQEGSSKAQWNIVNKVRIDIDVRAENRNVAKDVAEVLEASIFRSVGVSAMGATLSRVVEETGITRIPDKEMNESYRYFFSLRLTCMSDPDTAPTPSYE